MNNQENQSEWMTLDETAEFLRCSPRYLKEQVVNRQIPFTLFAGKALFNKLRINQWMLSIEEDIRYINGATSTSLPISSSPNVSKDQFVKIETSIQPICDFDKVNELVQRLTEHSDGFVQGLGRNLSKDLEKNNFQFLSEKVYAQLSRWCHPNRNSKREQWVRPIAHEISELLYGAVIPRTKHPSYYG